MNFTSETPFYVLAAQAARLILGRWVGFKNQKVNSVSCYQAVIVVDEDNGQVLEIVFVTNIPDINICVYFFLGQLRVVLVDSYSHSLFFLDVPLRGKERLN